jgi:hypothetical protein
LLLDGSVARRILKVIKPSADQFELALKPLVSTGINGEFKLESVDGPEPPKLHLVSTVESVKPKSQAKTEATASVPTAPKKN